MALDSSSILRIGGPFLALYVLIKILQKVYYNWTSPLNDLPGPKSTSWITGNMKEIWLDRSLSLSDKWFEQYGSTIAVHGLFGTKYMTTIDTKALNRVLNHQAVYGVSESARRNLSRVLGEGGLLAAQGEKHRQLRRVMNPAFGAPQIRELTEIFVAKSNLLRDVLLEEVKGSPETTINAVDWFNKMTLDVIGLAGFHYEFHALTSNSEQNELSKAFSKVTTGSTGKNLLNVARSTFPVLQYVPTKYDGETKKARDKASRIGQKLVDDSRAAILSENATLEKSTWKGKDLLSLLMKANMATDLTPDLRMSDEDVVNQIPTFLVAGHETTSTAISWAIFALTQSPQAQVKLRKELLSASTDTPTMDELNDLPYLDAVVREVLRLHAPVPRSMRVAKQDDVLPLSKPIVDRYGNTHDSIRVRKGTHIVIPILPLNRTETIWGPDAKEFKPERWTNSEVPQEAHAIPGVWGHMMTFMGGPRACIGYRFSLIELKALLFALIRAFEFELAVPTEEIVKIAVVVQRPTLKSDPGKGNQLPVKTRPVQMDKY